MQDDNPSPEPRRLRGFAAMSPEKKREIAGMGGRAAHAAGRAHQFSTEEARAAGKKRHQRPETQA
jgi:general stress protein YciG